MLVTLPSWHVVPSVFVGLLLGSLFGTSSDTWTLLRRAVLKLSGGNLSQRRQDTSLTASQSRWLVQNLIARLCALTLAYSQLCAIVNSATRGRTGLNSHPLNQHSALPHAPAPLDPGLLLGLCGALLLTGVHATSLFWLALDGHGYLAVAPRWHPRLCLLQALAVLACHCSGRLPVQFQVQAISQGLLLIMQQDSKDLFVLQLGVAGLLYQLAHAAQPYVHKWSSEQGSTGGGGTCDVAAGACPASADPALQGTFHSINASVQSTSFLAISLALIFIYNVYKKSFPLPRPPASVLDKGSLAFASANSSLPLTASGSQAGTGTAVSESGAASSVNAIGEMSRRRGGSGLAHFLLSLTGRRARRLSSAATTATNIATATTPVDSQHGGRACSGGGMCPSTSASIVSGGVVSANVASIFCSSFVTLNPMARAYLLKVLIARTSACVSAVLFGLAVVMDLAAGVSILSRAASLVSAMVMLAANVAHAVLIWRRPHAYLRSLHKYNFIVWAATVASLIGKHVEPWLFRQNPELMVVALSFASLHSFVHDDTFLRYAGGQVLLLAAAVLQTLLYGQGLDTSSGRLETLRDVCIYAAVCGFSCVAHAVNQQFRLTMRQPSFSSSPRGLRVSTSSSLGARASFESLRTDHTASQLLQPQLPDLYPPQQINLQPYPQTRMHAQPFQWRPRHHPPRRQASVPVVTEGYASTLSPRGIGCGGEASRLAISSAASDNETLLSPPDHGGAAVATAATSPSPLSPPLPIREDVDEDELVAAALQSPSQLQSRSPRADGVPAGVADRAASVSTGSPKGAMPPAELEDEPFDAPEFVYFSASGFGVAPAKESINGAVEGAGEAAQANVEPVVAAGAPTMRRGVSSAVLTQNPFELAPPVPPAAPVSAPARSCTRTVGAHGAAASSDPYLTAMCMLGLDSPQYGSFPTGDAVPEPSQSPCAASPDHTNRVLNVAVTPQGDRLYDMVMAQDISAASRSFDSSSANTRDALLGHRTSIRAAALREPVRQRRSMATSMTLALRDGMRPCIGPRTTASGSSDVEVSLWDTVLHSPATPPGKWMGATTTAAAAGNAAAAGAAQASSHRLSRPVSTMDLVPMSLQHAAGGDGTSCRFASAGVDAVITDDEEEGASFKRRTLSANISIKEHNSLRGKGGGGRGSASSTSPFTIQARDSVARCRSSQHMGGRQDDDDEEVLLLLTACRSMEGTPECSPRAAIQGLAAAVAATSPRLLPQLPHSGPPAGTNASILCDDNISAWSADVDVDGPQPYLFASSSNRSPITKGQDMVAAAATAAAAIEQLAEARFSGDDSLAGDSSRAGNAAVPREEHLISPSRAAAEPEAARQPAVDGHESQSIRVPRFFAAAAGLLRRARPAVTSPSPLGLGAAGAAAGNLPHPRLSVDDVSAANPGTRRKGLAAGDSPGHGSWHEHESSISMSATKPATSPPLSLRQIKTSASFPTLIAGGRGAPTVVAAVAPAPEGPRPAAPGEFPAVAAATGALRALGHQLRRLTSAPASRDSLSGNQALQRAASIGSGSALEGVGSLFEGHVSPMQLGVANMLFARRGTAASYSDAVSGTAGLSDPSRIEDYTPRDIVFGIIYTAQHAADLMHLLRAFTPATMMGTWLAAALLYGITLLVGVIYLSALRRRERWATSQRFRRIFWSVRLTGLHALRSTLYMVAGMQVPSLLGRSLVSSVAIGLLGLPADTFLRAMPIKIVVVYCLSCAKDPSRLAPLRLVVSLATYFVSSTLAFTAAAAAVSRVPLRLHHHAAVHCTIDAAASTAALEHKLEERAAAAAAAAAAVAVDNATGDIDFDIGDSASEILEADELEVDELAMDVLGRHRRNGRNCCGFDLPTVDFGVPRLANRKKLTQRALLSQSAQNPCVGGASEADVAASGTAAFPQRTRLTPNPVLCYLNTFLSNGNKLASVVFVLLTLLFSGVTRLLGHLGEHKSGFEPDPYFLVEQLMLNGVEAAVRAVMLRINAAEGVSGLPQTALAMSLFMVAVACVVFSQVVALAFSASRDPRIDLYQQGLAELSAAMSSMQLQETTRHGIAASVDKCMGEALDSCSALLVLVQAQATRPVKDGRRHPLGTGAMNSGPNGVGTGGGGPGSPGATSLGMEYDTHATVFVLHDRLLGSDLPPYKLPLEEVRHAAH